MHPDLALLSLLFFNVFLWQVGVETSWSCHTLRLFSSKKLSIRPFCWGIICFCTRKGSVRILKIAGGNIFLKWYYFEEIPKIISFWKKFSSLFQYSERTIAIEPLKDTSTERYQTSDTQLFKTGKSEGVTLSRGLHAHLKQKDIIKKVYLPYSLFAKPIIRLSIKAIY